MAMQAQFSTFSKLSTNAKPKFQLIYLAKEMKEKNYNPLKYGFPNLNSNIINEMQKNTTITIHFYSLPLLQLLLLTT